MFLFVTIFGRLNSNGYRSDIVDIVRNGAKAHGLNEAIVLGLVEQESQFNPYAFRLEPHMWERVQAIPYEKLSGHKPQTLPTKHTERVARAISWGLTQILGESARHYLKFADDNLTQLLDPTINVELGCCFLSRLYAASKGTTQIEKYRAALLAYNGGGNKRYPDDVFAKAKRWGLVYDQRD